ncbi:hypothetical protein GBZ48_07905 [Azospirillum melinis]|uniref:Uncharacterized protein n=1 Tax=Azospirillum melinis TaxID=328839 RepID=A0ABX2K6L3_9PROT|nr:hypothetical protein [Azospirillum melinis]
MNRISHRSPDQQGLYQPVAIDQIKRHIAGMTVRETGRFRETQEFAKALNNGQVDKAGAPYWMHLERVAAAWPRALPPEKRIAPPHAWSRSPGGR